MYETLEIALDKHGVATLWLDRADKHNAISAQMIAELSQAAAALAAGRLCISTEDASRGWSAHQFPGLITVSGDQEFAEKVVHYLRNPQLRHAHEVQPDDLLRRFDWSNRATEQALLYAS